MNKRHILTLINFLIVSFFVSNYSHAKQIPMGINWHSGLFLQEYWDAGAPKYCFSNTNAEDAEIQVRRWPLQDVEAMPLLQVVISAGATRCIDANAAAGLWHIEFKLAGGKRLGLLNGPQLPQTPDAEHKVVSLKGVNGSCNVPQVKLAQASLWGKSGQKMIFSLLTDGASTLYFSDTTDAKDVLPLTRATSDTLLVEHTEGQFILNAADQKAADTSHSVTLEVQLPLVDQPSMFFLIGKQRLAENGWRCLMRAILVAP